MEAPMATPTGSSDVGRIEREIAQVRGELGRTVQEIGSRLTPAHLMAQAKQGLKDATTDTTRAVANQATDVAAAVAQRTRDAAVDAKDRVQANPMLAGAIGVGAGLGFWAVAASRRSRRRLVPREWDAPGRPPARRVAGFNPGPRTSPVLPLLAAASLAFLAWSRRQA
jgi:ElaB/YqjD/DUF883 family membrane-anchored ribosome-binding protein